MQKLTGYYMRSSQSELGWPVVQLVESDIPGAELPKPAEFCTVAVAKYN